MYGKTIIKPVETYTIVKYNTDEFGKYITYNYNYVDSVIEVNGICYIKESPILSHCNYVPCGVEILSMSKLIMDQVFSCADDCGVKNVIKIQIQPIKIMTVLIKLLRYIKKSMD